MSEQQQKTGWDRAGMVAYEVDKRLRTARFWTAAVAVYSAALVVGGVWLGWTLAAKSGGAGGEIKVRAELPEGSVRVTNQVSAPAPAITVDPTPVQISNDVRPSAIPAPVVETRLVVIDKRAPDDALPIEALSTPVPELDATPLPGVPVVDPDPLARGRSLSPDISEHGELLPAPRNR